MKPLTLTRFRELVLAYGADVDRFPEAERAAARALVDTSDDARALLAAEAPLDDALGALTPPPLPAGLSRRLLEVPLRSPPRRLPRAASRWLPGLSWAAAAALGVWVGVRWPEPEAGGADQVTVQASDDQDVDSQLALASGALADDWEEP